MNVLNRICMVLAVAVAVAMAVPLSILAYQQFCRWTDNFYEVVPGQFYRSAQLTPDGLAKRIDRYAIKTVINLRGVRTLPDWYQGERHVTELHGVRLIDFPMSASNILPPERALALVNLMKKAQKPILVHCLSGADRTGLVSVIYVSQVAGIDEETAERQLSPYYGHFGIPFFRLHSRWTSHGSVSKACSVSKVRKVRRVVDQNIGQTQILLVPASRA